MDDRKKQVLFLERLKNTADKAAENGNMITEEELKRFPKGTSLIRAARRFRILRGGGE